MSYLVLFIFLHFILEALPISSSGHLMLFEDWPFFSVRGVRPTYVSPYLQDLLHGASAVVIALVFYPAWSGLLGSCFVALERRHAGWWSHRRLLKLIGKIFCFGVVIECITVACYFGFPVIAPQFFLQFRLVVVWVMLWCTFTLFMALRRYEPQLGAPYESLTLLKACVLGVAQGFATLPGLSRFGATYMVSRFMRISPRRSLELSFLIQFPLMLAATVKSFYYLGSGKMVALPLDGAVSAAVLLGCVCAYFLLQGACWMAYRGYFWLFGYYLLLPLGMVVWMAFAKS